MSFRCATCDEIHEGLPDIGWDRPDPCYAIPEGEGEGEGDQRINLTSDTCIIDNEDFFIRGVLEIPINGQQASLGLGVWVSQKRENFYKYLENFDSADIGPFFGWLSNSIGYYLEDTYCLKTMAHFRGCNDRPTIELEPTNHSLAIDQREGISLEKAWEIVHSLIGSKITEGLSE
ncbi:MAG TPA: DUF2199 domain-containing protein [Blastocatellia bacterium]|nr:DUF2199 domain-containing protein [Blastocatellia bacterium]